MKGIKHNGVIVSIQKWNSHKLPVLAVSFEDENRVYKVASFNNEETAHWFEEVMDEFFKGLVEERNVSNKADEQLLKDAGFEL